MSIPTTTVTSGGSAYSPTSAAVQPEHVYRHERAYVLHADPRDCEVVDLEEKYAALLNIPAGKYLLPGVQTIMAVPGANGVRGMSDWTMEQLLSLAPNGGFHEIAKDMALRGTPLLDPMAPVPKELLPEGATPGGYLRFTITQDQRGRAGRCHHSAWQHLETTGIGESSKLVTDYAAYNAWKVWLVLTGRFPPANEAALDRATKNARGRLDRARSSAIRVLGLPEGQREQVLAPRQTVVDDLKAATRASTSIPKTEPKAPRRSKADAQ